MDAGTISHKLSQVEAFLESLRFPVETNVHEPLTLDQKMQNMTDEQAELTDVAQVGLKSHLVVAPQGCLCLSKNLLGAICCSGDVSHLTMKLHRRRRMQLSHSRHIS